MITDNRPAAEFEEAMRHLQAASFAFYRGFLRRPTDGSLAVLRGLSEVLREVTREAVSTRRRAGWRIPIIQVDGNGNIIRRSIS